MGDDCPRVPRRQRSGKRAAVEAPKKVSRAWGWTSLRPVLGTTNTEMKTRRSPSSLSGNPATSSPSHRPIFRRKISSTGRIHSCLVQLTLLQCPRALPSFLEWRNMDWNQFRPGDTRIIIKGRSRPLLIVAISLAAKMLRSGLGTQLYLFTCLFIR
jgi:hypothetical protein